MLPINRLRLTLLLLAAAGTVLPGACVWRTHHTIETTSKIEAHIVLDIRQVKDEGAAVEDYVRGNTSTPPPAPGGKPTSMMTTPAQPWSSVFDLAGRAAAADEIMPAGMQTLAPRPMVVSAADEKGAIERRRARAAEVSRGLDSKQLGENEKGYLTVLEGSASNDLAEAENADRKVIYQAIAERQGHPEARGQVELLMAETIREKLKSGQMFQVPSDEVAFKRFQDSALGKKYPNAKKGEWLAK